MLTCQMECKVIANGPIGLPRTILLYFLFNFWHMVHWKNAWNGMIKGTKMALLLIQILSTHHWVRSTLTLRKYDFQVVNSNFLKSCSLPKFWISKLTQSRQFVFLWKIGYCKPLHVSTQWMDLQWRGQSDSELRGRMTGRNWVVQHQKTQTARQLKSRTFVEGRRISQTKILT